MAVTKILPRNGGLKEAIDYVLNGDKTDGHMLTVAGGIVITFTKEILSLITG